MTKKILILALMFAAAVSCAEKDAEDTSAREQEAFDAWMVKYHPQAEKRPSGIYVEWLERNPSGRVPEAGNWLMTDFTRSFMDGTVYSSNDPAVARRMGYYSARTYFFPKYFEYLTSGMSTENYAWSQNLAVGEVELLSMMREGEKARAYLPKKWAYPYGGYSYEVGFSPQIPVDAFTAVQMDIGLTRIISDPVEHEKGLVEEYAESELGLEADQYTAPGLYMKITEPYDLGHTVTKDSTVSVYYTGRFLDGFIFDTNIDTVALNHGIYNPSAGYLPISLRPDPDSEESSYVKGFTRAILNMKKGDRATAVFVSSLGYGMTGNPASTTASTTIPPYTPLIFDIYVEYK